MRIKVLDGKGAEEESEEDHIINASVIQTNEGQYFVGGVGDFLTVFKYLDLDTKIKTSIEAGSISQVSRLGENTQIYSINLGRGQEKVRYVCPMLGEYLLIAKDEKTIREMVMAGTGQAESFVDSELFDVIEAAYPDLGVSWTCTISGAIGEGAKDYFEKRGEEVIFSDEHLAEIEKRHWCRFQATSIADGLAHILIECYSDEELAEDAKRTYFARQLKMRPGTDPKYMRIREERNKRTEVTVRDSMLIVKTRYDEELIKMERERFKAVEDAKKKRELEKK